MPRPLAADRLRWSATADDIGDSSATVDFDADRAFEDSDGVPQVEVTLRIDAVLDGDSLRRIADELPAVVTKARLCAMREFAVYDSAVAGARALGKHRPHGRSYPDDWWARVSDVYEGFVNSGIHDPTQRFSTESGVPIATVSRWVSHCRDEGFFDQPDGGFFLTPEEIPEEWQPTSEEVERALLTNEFSTVTNNEEGEDQ